ncbi:transposase [Streptomyces incanus]|uniref:Transposase n=1 Tax=Streptomyces incanus TaxID=887453 RepID=A0ABW0XWL5_9ACTN
MAEKRRKFAAEFREGAVRIVSETGKPVPEVANDLGINETTLASRVSRAKRAGKTTPEDEGALLARPAAENAALKKENRELGMGRDVLKRWFGGIGTRTATVEPKASTPRPG